LFLDGWIFMFRRLSSVLAVLSLLIFSASPSGASAAGLEQRSSINPTTYQVMAGTGLAKVGSKSHVAIWTQADAANELDLYVAPIDSAGQFGTTKRLFKIDSPFMANPSFSFSTDSKGRLALGMSVIRKIGSSYISSVYVWFTNDGLNWSTPVMVAPEYVDSEGCVQLEGGCGYAQVQLLFGSKDLLALVYAKVKPGGAYSVLATSSANGVTWATPTVLDQASAGVNWLHSSGQIQLTAVGDSILAQFNVYQGGAWTLGSSGIFDQHAPAWSALETRESSTTFGETHSAVTPDMGLASFTWTYTQTSVDLRYAKWDSKTKTWGATSTVYSCACQYIESSYKPAAAYKSSINFMWVENVANTAPAMKMLTLTNGSNPSVVTLKQTADTGQRLYVVANYFANDGTQSLMFVSSADSATFVGNVANGVLGTPTQVPQASPWVYSIDIDIDAASNVSVLYLTQDPVADIFTLSYQSDLRGSAPVATGATKVTGKATVKSKLTGAGPKFASLSGVSVSKYQWYACIKQVKKASVSLPQTCKPIKGATKSSYVITKTDSKKFILLAVSSSNIVGTTTSFSASTLAVK
jgi:hypothetical protein